MRFFSRTQYAATFDKLLLEAPSQEKFACALGSSAYIVSILQLTSYASVLQTWAAQIPPRHWTGVGHQAGVTEVLLTAKMPYAWCSLSYFSLSALLQTARGLWMQNRFPSMSCC
eukprot:6483473-Amphidinium_carterae.2